MAKRIKLIYTLLLSVLLPLLTACSSDDLANSSDPNKQGDKVTVRFRVSQAGTNTMRAVGDWEDKVAEDKEMMNIWTVIAVNADDDKVAGIWSCKPSGKPNQEVDEIEEIFKAELDKGVSYRFYSFANMGAAYLKGILGFTSDIIPVPEDDNEIAENIDNLGNTTLTEQKVNSAVVSINGNGFDPTLDNGFGDTGIPMSNVQTFESLEDGSLKDLIVVRMLAKVELWLYNGKGGESDEDNLIEVNSITLTDITKNGEQNNLYLLPKYKNEYSDWADSMDPGKLEPNRTETAATVDLTISSGAPTDGKPVVKEDGTTSDYKWTVKAVENRYVDGTGKGNDNPIKIVFYVNESATPTTPHANPGTTTEQEFGHFFLEMDVEGDMPQYKQRYVMIDDKNKDGSSGNWNYIARNDYRIIPIVLDDYKLDMIPYDFPAIGVLPASVKEEDGIYTINFHDYGHFHLQPKVTRYSDGTLVPYGKSGAEEDKTYWTLAGVNTTTPSQELSKLTNVWTSWTNATKTTSYDNTGAAAFYRIVNDTEFNYNDPKDGDEVGGEPVWYLNNASPQWASDWAPKGTLDYQPFIFGYIADPEAPLGDNDRKVYHEFTIYLYKNGDSPARQMTYRLYMILDTDQMLYRSNSAPRVRPPHCLH